MRNQGIARTLGIAVLYLGVSGHSLEPDKAAPSLIGTWILVAFDTRDSAGTLAYPLGQHPQGILIYDAKHRVVAQLLDPDLPPFISGDRARGTDAEVRAAFNGSFAYYGHFRIDANHSTVTHRVEGASFPNWIGTDLVRSYRLDHDATGRDRLTITTPPTLIGGQRLATTLTWRRG